MAKFRTGLAEDTQPLMGWQVKGFCALLLIALLAIDWCTVCLNPSIVYVALLGLYVQLGGRRASWGLGLTMVGLVYGGYFFGARSGTVTSRLELLRKTAMLNRTFVAFTVVAIGLIARKGWGIMNQSASPDKRRQSNSYPRIIGDDTLVATVCFVIALGIFVLDLRMPLNINPAILYGVVIVLAGRTQSRSFVWGLTVATVILTFVGYLESPRPAIVNPQATYFTNRLIVMFVLVVLGMVVHLSLKEGPPAVWSSKNQVTRILHVIAGIHPGQGGPTTALIGFCKAQIRDGKEVSIISTWGTEIEVLAAMSLREIGARITLIGPVLGPLLRHPDLRRSVAEAVSQADMVHIHGLWEDIQHQAADAAERMGVPHIIRPCGMLDPWSLAHHRMRKLLYMAWRLRRHLNRASAIHLTTPAECEAVARLGLAAPVIVEPLGVDFNEFDPLPAAGTFRDDYPQLQGRPCIMFFGRVCPKKGVHLLLEAMANLKDKRAMLVIVGPMAEGYQTTLDAIIERHNLTDRILFAGMLTGRRRVEALTDADLFVLPSFQENFGVAVVEAMAARCPVIVSPEVAIARDIVDWEVGEIAPLEAHGLAAVIDRWLADPAKRQAAGRRGREAVYSHYDWEEVARGWDDHYQYLSNIANHRVVAVEAAETRELVTVDA